jgi:hypothetical protein
MPIRRASLRIRALFLAALYLAVPAGVLGVRPCEHHDGKAADGSAAVELSRGVPDEAGAASSHSHEAAHGPERGAFDHAAEHCGAAVLGADADESKECGHRGCECVGACTPSSVLAPPERAGSLVDAQAQMALASEGPAADSDVVPPHLLPHALPWSVGPPVDPA